MMIYGVVIGIIRAADVCPSFIAFSVNSIHKYVKKIASAVKITYLTMSLNLANAYFFSCSMFFKSDAMILIST